MIHKIYAVYDVKADIYMLPFFAKTDDVALRAFATAALNPEHDFGRWGGDYTLFEIGYYNDENANIDPAPAFQNHGTALQVAAAFHTEEKE